MKTFIFIFLFLFSFITISAQTKQKIEFNYDSTNYVEHLIDTLYVNYNIDTMNNSKFFNIFDIVLKNKNINCAVLQMGIYEPTIDGEKNTVYFNNFGLLDIDKNNSTLLFDKEWCNNSKLPINFNYTYRITLIIRLDENSNKDYYLHKIITFK
jgi:hypothetical protein